jgi:secondary thiamine-phosphate synthase enzyme
VFSPHTTVGLTINERTDPDVRRDMIHAMERIVPWNDPAYRHDEGNSAAHLKASLMGSSVVLPIAGGRLGLGTWQGIFLCEFDGPRRRHVMVSITPSAAR